MFSMFAILWDAYIVKKILLFWYILMLKKTFIVKSASFIDNQAQLFHILTIFEFLYNNRYYQGTPSSYIQKTISNKSMPQSAFEVTFLYKNMVIELFPQANIQRFGADHEPWLNFQKLLNVKCNWLHIVPLGSLLYWKVKRIEKLRSTDCLFWDTKQSQQLD